MTRENKLALVVGFGLILFVGILISDHFSIVRTQQAADLRKVAAVDPLSPRNPETNLIDLTSGQRQTPTPAFSPTTIANAGNAGGVVDPVRPEQRTIINPNGMTSPQRIVQQVGMDVTVAGTAPPRTPDGFVPAPNEPAANQVKVVYHDVRSGETMFAICRQYYGDTNLVASLAKFNKMDDPASIRAGRRLIIPTAEQLGGRSTPPANAAPTESPSATVSTPSIVPIKVLTASSATGNANTSAKPTTTPPTTYTVKPGDSLAQIAQRFLGSKKKWKKLHDMNKDVIDDPDDLKVGMVLKVL